MDSISYTKSRADVVVNDFVRSVYNWMCIGLALTGFIAFYVSHSETMMRMIFGNSFIFLVSSLPN